MIIRHSTHEGFIAELLRLRGSVAGPVRCEIIRESHPENGPAHSGGVDRVSMQLGFLDTEAEDIHVHELACGEDWNGETGGTNTAQVVRSAVEDACRELAIELRGGYFDLG